MLEKGNRSQIERVTTIFCVRRGSYTRQQGHWRRDESPENCAGENLARRVAPLLRRRDQVATRGNRGDATRRSRRVAPCILAIIILHTFSSIFKRVL